MIPHQLRKLIDEGIPQKPVFKEYAVLSTCTRCHVKVLCARADYPVGYDRKADAEPLNQMGEAWALSNGLTTYRLNGVAPAYLRLDTRITWDISETPVGMRLRSGAVIHVVMEHKCGMLCPVQYREDWVN